MIAGSIYAQKVAIKPKPGWVKEYPQPEDSGDTTNIIGGYYNIVSDDQNNIPLKESFHHYVQKVISTKGLENISTITQNFDPSYEKLSFHWINVVRNGKKIDQLLLNNFRVLNREQNLERLMYDGYLTAVFDIYDLQVGDVLDYAYSLQGENPVFGDKYSRIFYLNSSAPVGLIIRRIVTNANHNYQFKKFNNATDALITTSENEKIYEWVHSNVPAVLWEESTPGWFDPYDYVQISDYETWEDVSFWASSLFTKSQSPRKLLKEIPGVSLENKRVSIRKIIQFVQDEVRYLSFSDGIHGYQPHRPDKILSQRFGDCKDKSFLLATLLRELGVKCNPTLVNTSYGKTLPELLPSPTLFDHCIVQFTYNDSTYWVDPTYTLQRGPLNRIFMQNYYHALPVSTDSKGLEPIGVGDGGKIEAEESFIIEDPNEGGAKMMVRTTYEGAEADDMRSYFRSNSLAEIEKNFLNYYANEYPDIKSSSQVKWTDNEEENIIVCEESYKIYEFWKYNTESKKYIGPTYARTISTYLSKPTTKLRGFPYSVRFPINVTQHITLRLPGEWTLEDEDHAIESAGFHFTSRVRYEGRVLQLSYSYSSKKPFVGRDEIRDHIAKVDEALGSLGYNLAWGDDSNDKTSTSTKVIIVLALITAYLSYRWFIKPRMN